MESEPNEVPPGVEGWRTKAVAKARRELSRLNGGSEPILLFECEEIARAVGYGVEYLVGELSGATYTSLLRRTIYIEDNDDSEMVRRFRHELIEIILRRDGAESPLAFNGDPREYHRVASYAESPSR